MPPNILIAGGGIGGLTAAIALKKFGADVQVVERSASNQTVGAGITIQANAMAIFNALGIVIPAENTCSMGRFQMIGSKGRVLMSGNADNIDMDTPSVNVHRFDLHDALLQKARIEGVSCRLGSELTFFELSDRGVEAQFQNGSRVQCDLLVGADGAHSTVRRILLGDSAGPIRYSGQTCWRFAIEAPDLVPDITTERWLPGIRAGVIPISRGRIYVYLVKSSPQGTPSASSNSPEVLKENFGGIDALLDTVFERLDETTSIHHGDLFDRPQIHFGSGRVVLIGDAAHVMTPNMGQGAGMAIEDAATLSMLVGKHTSDLDPCATELAEMRTRRVRGVLKTSWRIGQAAHAANPAVRAVRDFLLSKMPTAMTERQATRMWNPGLEIANSLKRALRSCC